MTPAESKWAHLSYLLSLSFKALIGVLQLAGGFGLLLVPGETISAYIAALARLELIRNPEDAMAQWVAQAAAQLPIADERFYMVYLIVHGLLNLGLVLALIARLHWAYPVSIVALLGFAAYQTYDFFLGKGVLLLVLTAIDLIVIALVGREWQVQRRHWATNSSGKGHA